LGEAQNKRYYKETSTGILRDKDDQRVEYNRSTGTSLRTAYAEELNLKKEQTSYSDLLDVLRLSLKGYNII
jgi:hypothetical protein